MAVTLGGDDEDGVRRSVRGTNELDVAADLLVLALRFDDFEGWAC